MREGRAWRGLTGLACAAACSAPGAASTATSTFQVTATMQATCKVAVTSLAFGTYHGTQNDVTASVSATCTSTTPYTISVDAGLHSAGSYQWNMTGPASQLLGYRLYRDAARTLLWGSTAGTDTVAGTGNSGTQTITIYGRIPALQFPTPGSFLDTVVVSLTY